MPDTTPLDKVPLDPARPWITDPEDLPSGMHWASTLLSPFGLTSRVHFTRAWSVLFFARVFIIVFPMFFGWIISTAGGDASGLTAFARTAVPIVLLGTVFLSFNIHIKRLYHAGKPALLAALVFIPLMIAGFAFVSVALGAGEKYETAAAKRLFEIEHPEEARAEREAAAAKAAEEKAEAESGEGSAKPDGPNAATNQRGRSGGRRGGGRGQSSGAGIDAGGQPITKAKTMLNAAQPIGQWLLIFLDFPLMLWSLLWVARKPGKSKAHESAVRQSHEAF